MLTRFKQNVSRYPKLFAALLVGLALAIAESCAVNSRNGVAVDLTLSVALTIPFYLFVIRNARRMTLLLNILELFEGRGVCTIAEHCEENDSIDDFSLFDEESQ